MIKYLLLYVLLACLSLTFIVVIDLQAGLSFSMALRAFRSVFSAVTPPEKAAMIFALALPFLQAGVNLLRQAASKPTSKPVSKPAKQE